MAMALAEAAGRYGHVLLPGNLHAPVVQLSRYLVQRGPGQGWASRCFYSDNGASAIEIALKMGLRLSEIRRRNRGSAGGGGGGDEVVVLAQLGSYHGDTLGAMSLSSPSMLNNTLQHPWYRARSESLPVPYVSVKKDVVVIDASELSAEVRAE